jgi:predicted nucleic acid-binding protein
MNVLIDTNVVLDILLQREPYHESAARISVLAEKGYIRGYLSASAITDIYYIARKELKSRDNALQLIKDILKVIHVAAVTENSIHAALDLEWDDFEDSIQYVVGQTITADYIVTRNPKDFAGSEIAVLPPEEFIDVVFVEE